MICLLAIAYRSATLVNALQGLQYGFLFILAVAFSRRWPEIFNEEMTRRVIIQKSIATLRQLGREGKIIPEVEKSLVDLEMRTVPLAEYSAALQQFMDEGKLIPAIASKILDEYKSQKAEIGPTGSVNKMLQEAEAAAYGEINDLLKEAGK